MPSVAMEGDPRAFSDERWEEPTLRVHAFKGLQSSYNLVINGMRCFVVAANWRRGSQLKMGFQRNLGLVGGKQKRDLRSYKYVVLSTQTQKRGGEAEIANFESLRPMGIVDGDRVAPLATGVWRSNRVVCRHHMRV